MQEFDFTPKVCKYVSEKLDIIEPSIKVMQKVYDEFSANMKMQYLAHAIRTMESELRKRPGNQFFRIICEPLQNIEPNFSVGCAKYHPHRFYSIFFNPHMDEKQLRVCLAHELGHLFLIEFASIEKNEKVKTEPLSSLFGILTLLEKNDFYKNKSRKYLHNSWEDVVDDFSQFRNRENGKENLS